MRPIDADAYIEKAKQEAEAMPKEQGEDFVALTEWLMAKTPTAELPATCEVHVTMDTDEILRRIKEEYVLVAGWIPCAERLPENKHEKCLVNVILKDSPNKIIISDFVAYDYARGWIDAWMPLPEPYEEDNAHVDTMQRKTAGE